MNPEIRFVLVRTSHPGNIGAAARAMQTMALNGLWLVQPRRFPDPEATARAAGAGRLLEEARCCKTLAQAVRDCRLVAATSVRQRRPAWPLRDARAGARWLLEAAGSGPVAVVFGEERSGLSNDDLELCNALIRIPTASEYGSLNLAMAVQILAYELRMAATASPEVIERRELPTASQRADFFASLEQMLVRSGFLNPDEPRLLMPRLRRLYDRASPDITELQILRGIVSCIEQVLETRNGR